MIYFRHASDLIPFHSARIIALHILEASFFP